jgi:hypothetical protein
MALEYDLTLAGNAPVEEVARRAFPDLEDRPTGAEPPLWAALWEKYGFGVTVYAGKNRYINVETDDGMWEWEPEESVAASFRMDKFADFHWEVVNMLTVVRRVLDTGSEDTVLVLNGDVLLLSRFDGVLVKHRRSWWTGYPGSNDVIAGSWVEPDR